MGFASLLAPLVVPKLLRPFTPGRGRLGKAVVATAVGAVALTSAADLVVHLTADRDRGAAPAPDDDPVMRAVPSNGSVQSKGTVSASAVERSERTVRRSNVLAGRVCSVGGVTAIVVGGIAVTTTWNSRTSPDRFWRRRFFGGSGRSPLALAAAIFGWDFIYYWNHRFMHESRYLWALHVVHHSSERYNLSTALRQPVADSLGTSIPYGLLCLVGIEPALVATARGVNLLYQFWIHTETIGKLGPVETVFNTASHHRVHHGSNRQYLDRNHGSILIVWDRLFGTFEPENDRVVYGLTKNIKTFNPGWIAIHEYRDMLRDVAGSSSWRDRLSFVIRGPGWAGRRRAELDVAASGAVAPSVAEAARGVRCFAPLPASI
jgi:sterol desaturase/sphingolipid hydroxylase (fatty acid hydroxylase superfamily)